MRISCYIDELRMRLKGRIPTGDLQEILVESEEHLNESASSFGVDRQLDAEELAIQRFGSAKRYAFRILQARNQPAPLWRAARWPLIVASTTWALGFVWTFTINRHVGPYSPPPWVSNWIPMSFEWLSMAFLVACLRARRLLIGPLAVACAGFCLASLVVVSITCVAVPGQGGSFIELNKGDVAEFLSQTPQRIHVLETKLSRLEEGKRLFAGREREVPEYLGTPGWYQNPESVSGLNLDGPRMLMVPRTPWFIQHETVRENGGGWSKTARGWKDVDRYIDHVQGALALEKKETILVQEARNGGMLLTAVRAAPRQFWLSVSCFLVLVYMNAVAWLASLVWSRIAWPRRRYA